MGVKAAHLPTPCSATMAGALFVCTQVTELQDENERLKKDVRKRHREDDVQYGIVVSNEAQQKQHNKGLARGVRPIWARSRKVREQLGSRQP
jgi:hypothetical protein